MEFNDHVFENWNRTLTFIDPSTNYIFSYPELLDASNCLVSKFGEKAVPMLGHLVYGWMPKILSYSREKYQDGKIFEATTVKTREEALKVVKI